MSYNGWTNYETWLLALWIDNDPGAQEYWRERATGAIEVSLPSDSADLADLIHEAAHAIADELESDTEENSPAGITGFYADIINAAMRDIDYYSIAQHWLEEIPVYSAGHNTPGYMPDSPPDIFLDETEALESIKSLAVDYIEESPDMAPADREKAITAIQSWRADQNGEFGQTVNGSHYFVSRM